MTKNYPAPQRAARGNLYVQNESEFGLFSIERKNVQLIIYGGKQRGIFTIQNNVAFDGQLPVRIVACFFNKFWCNQLSVFICSKEEINGAIAAVGLSCGKSTDRFA